MTVPMLMMPPPTAERTRFSDWPFAVKSILGFWIFYALTVVIRAFLGTDPWTTVENKLTIIGLGLVINGLIYVAIAGLTKGAPIQRKVIVSAISCVVGAVILGSAVVMTEDLMRE